MKAACQVPDIEIDRLLNDTARRREQISVTCKAADGWRALKSSFLEVDPREKRLVIAYPSGPAHSPIEIVNGQFVGVSFRRGHKKLVFNTLVVLRYLLAHNEAGDVPALQLEWPRAIFEMQRRLYQRVAIPPGTVVAASLWPGSAPEPPASGTSVYRGAVLDVSLGGISVALPPDRAPDWPDDSPATCSILPGPAEPAITVDGRLRYRQIGDGGTVRIGLQFVGLDARPDLQAEMEGLVRLAVRFRRGPARPRPL